MPRRKVDLAAVVFALLVVATLAAFAYAQRVKRDPLVLDRVGIGPKNSNAFSPPCERIKLKFRTTTSNDGTVEVIRPGGEIVAKLARHTFLKRYSFHTFFWDGTNEDGVDPAARPLQAAGDPRRRRAHPHRPGDDPPAEGAAGRPLRRSAAKSDGSGKGGG